MAKTTQEQPTDPESTRAHEHDDDVIVAPKGSKRARFIMTFLLAITLLTTFSVSSSVIDVFTGQGGRGSAYLTWRDLHGEEQSMTGNEFLIAKQNLAKVFQVMFGRQVRENSDDDTAYFLVQADIADDAGVHITATELGKFITDRFGGGSNYHAVIGQMRISARDFEATLRKLLAIERYKALITSGLMTPSMPEVEKLWRKRHQEYAFDYIELPVEGLREDATAQVPSDDELKAWFDALPEAKKNAYKRGVAASAELAVFTLDPLAPTDKLFAKWPRPADEDLEVAAKEYYDGNSFQRFRNHNLPTDRQPQPSDFFLPFENEDVQATAKREAPIFRSLQAWQLDMGRRVDEGQTVDLAAEAADLGLAYYKEEKPLTLEEWTKLEHPWMSRNVADWITGTAIPGKFPPTLSVDEKSLIVGRAFAKEEPRTPEYAELKDKVREDWITNRMGELALAKLESVRDKLGTRPDPSDPAAPPYLPEADAEKFAAAASELGFQVQRLDYMERAKNPNKTPAETYLRVTSPLYSTKENTVVKAELARDGKNAYLVRVAGLRDADSAQMTPAEMQALTQQAGQEALRAFYGRTFDSKEFMRDHYGVHLKSWDAQTEAN